jgi:hypothetical protein
MTNLLAASKSFRSSHDGDFNKTGGLDGARKLLNKMILEEVMAAPSNPARFQTIGHKPQHTAITFLQRGIVGVSSSKMSDEQKKAVLDRHNKLRSKRNATYQPCTAADMEAMVWDDKLAAESQAWADGCIGDHADRAGKDFGENLFMSMPDTSYTSDALTKGVQDWYDEIVDSVWHLDDKKGSCKPGKVCGHYWQVVWAKSKRVGCGVAACTKSLTVSGADHGSGILMVCRYDPPAGLRGEGDTTSSPYIFGKPCAACPDHCSNGLCIAPPIRCLDKLGGDNTITISGTTYDSCPKLVKDYSDDSSMPWCTQLASMMSAEHTCELSCGKCKVPAGVGKECCGDGDCAKAQGKGADKATEKSKGEEDSDEQDQDKNDDHDDDDDDDDDQNDEKDRREAMKAKMREQMRAKMKAKMEEKNKGRDNDDDDGWGDGGWNLQARKHGRNHQ